MVLLAKLRDRDRIWKPAVSRRDAWAVILHCVRRGPTARLRLSHQHRSWWLPEFAQSCPRKITNQMAGLSEVQVLEKRAVWLGSVVPPISAQGVEVYSDGQTMGITNGCMPKLFCKQVPSCCDIADIVNRVPPRSEEHS